MSVEIFVELIVQILIEFIGQIVFEFLIEFGVRGFVRRRPQRKWNPVVTFIGYALLAAAGGWLSLLVFPEHFIKEAPLRTANLIFTPVFLGLLMSLRGKLLIKRGRFALRLDSFVFGYGFAVTFALVRLWFSK
ncbi:MAG: hypothetical protein A2X94_05550 [Bdellovibrionales bacterium GWB1_55_8]|nr:MAG: hypothetical protein A2X94_05550 [Bdellovibrionales bacterium GWB1_55_8]